MLINVNINDDNDDD